MARTFVRLVRRLLPFVLANLLLETLEATALLLRGDVRIGLGWQDAVSATGWLCMTLLSTLCTLVPLILYLCLLPGEALGGRTDRRVTAALFFAFVLLNAFEEVASLLFWDEFASKFNFVAVDYLVYTREVVGNIVQSYPVVPIMVGLLLFSAAATWAARTRLVPPERGGTPRLRRLGAAACLAGCMAVLQMPDYMTLTDRRDDRCLTEISRDGLYSLAHAFLGNELEYDRFYPVLPGDEAERRYDRLRSGRRDAAAGDAPARRRNVIVVLMESMGSEFLSESRTDGPRLTPNLEALAAESLYFSRAYATGTRSVRGIEAATLGVPPLPGMAIVRRDGNDRLRTLGSCLAASGYELKWIYGGYGYFDNMNAYFSGNGFRVVDRRRFDAAETSFANIWGVCDEDLFRKVIKEADESFRNGRPFLDVVLTTSNHRPYTYPEGRIPLPPKTSGRKGGVMYADHAVGRFMQEAKARPWYADTVFVLMADHGAGSAGRKELDVENHRIPIIIHAPGLVAARKVGTPVSQIDMIPTLLGILGLPHDGFMGQDALSANFSPRIFLSNYQKIAYADGADGFGSMVVMSPVRRAGFYHDGRPAGEARQTDAAVAMTAPDERLQATLDNAIAFYRHADRWREWMKAAAPGDGGTVTRTRP